MATKKVTLRAFRVDDASDLFEGSRCIATILLEKLNKSIAADERRMTLNAGSETKEQDLIASFYEGSAITPATEKCVHCLMMRIAVGNVEKHVTELLLRRGKFDLTDLGESSVEGAKAFYRSHYYFCLSNKYVVTNMPGNRPITGLQAYLNWYLKKLHELTPLIDTQVITSLSDISLVDFQDGRLYSADDLKHETDTTLLSIAKSFLKDILKDANTVDDAILSKHISATLKISIKQPKASDPDDFQKTLGALMKPLSDLDNVVIHTKHKGKITKGSEILRVKDVKIEELEDGLLNEPELRNAMERFLQEISK